MSFHVTSPSLHSSLSVYLVIVFIFVSVFILVLSALIPVLILVSARRVTLKDERVILAFNCLDIGERD